MVRRRHMEPRTRQAVAKGHGAKLVPVQVQMRKVLVLGREQNSADTPRVKDFAEAPGRHARFPKPEMLEMIADLLGPLGRSLKIIVDVMIGLIPKIAGGIITDPGDGSCCRLGVMRAAIGGQG